MFVPRKPHLFGNEFHTICCGLCGILFALEIVMGKDAPPQFQLAFEVTRKPTIGLLLRLTQALHHTGKIVLGDSGLCVLEAVTKLKSYGVHSGMYLNLKF